MVFRNLRERFAIDDQDYQVGSPSQEEVWLPALSRQPLLSESPEFGL